MEKSKTCTKCSQKLPATPEYFNRSKKGCKLGLRGHCKRCQAREGKEYWERTKKPPREIDPRFRACTNCGRIYPATTEFFHMNKYVNEKYGEYSQLRSECRICCNAKSNKYRENNRDSVLARMRKYQDKNKDTLLVRAKERYLENRERRLESVHQYRQNNPDKVRETRKKHYQNYKERVKQKRAEYYQENKETILGKDKVYKEKHRDRYRKFSRERKRRLYATDLMFNLNEKISSGIRISLRNGKEGRCWEDLVDFTVNDLIRHLESLFKPGMTWEHLLNGEIHIDHIRPKASFNFTTPEDPEFKQCWALGNLQPLWAVDNLKKGHKWKV